MYQGHVLSKNHIKRELGDILWMVAEYATSQGWKLQDVAETNLEKLNARYPNGFEVDNEPAP